VLSKERLSSGYSVVKRRLISGCSVVKGKTKLVVQAAALSKERLSSCRNIVKWKGKSVVQATVLLIDRLIYLFRLQCCHWTAQVIFFVRAKMFP